MKARAMALAVVLLSPVVGTPVVPAQETQNPQPQQAPATQQPEIPDQMQAQYIQKHQNIYKELKNVHNKLLVNLKLQTSELNREQPKQRRGGATTEVRMAYVGLRAEQRNIELRIRQLDLSSEALKQDAQKAYDGKIPKSVSDAWSTTEAEYAKFLEGFSEQLKKEGLEGQRMK